MTYEQAVKQASRKAIQTGHDWYVLESEEGCTITDDCERYGYACIYIAEPCAESAMIADR